MQYIINSKYPQYTALSSQNQQVAYISCHIARYFQEFYRKGRKKIMQQDPFLEHVGMLQHNKTCDEQSVSGWRFQTQIEINMELVATLNST